MGKFKTKDTKAE